MRKKYNSKYTIRTAICLINTIAFSFLINAQEINVDSLADVNLKEVEVISSFSKNKFIEPVSLSTIDSRFISSKMSNQEAPEILKSIPSIYASKQGGGLGDSRVTLRGFNSDNIAMLINGIPINGMENGAVYWSNWASLSDVARSIQVQRGIGLSKLGLYSVGGTINIITTGTSPLPGASIYYGLGNDNYQKYGINIETGESATGWSATFMGTRTTGNGYVNGTSFELWSYYFGLSKTIGRNHKLNFTVFGSPQWHNRRANKYLIEDYDSNRDGIKMNRTYGYINGKEVATYSGYNKYHKPQITLNHYWNINDKSTLSTSIYASFATGGGRKVIGSEANRIQYNYKTGRPNPTTDLTPEGLIDYAPVMDANKASDKGSKAIFTMGTNSHRWFGAISTYNTNLTPDLSLSAGFDGRYYIGDHYDEITDLLGGEYFTENKLAWRDATSKLKVGDRVQQDYTSYIWWLSAFGQLQYTHDRINTFVSFSLSNLNFQRYDPGKYGEYSDQSIYPSGEVRTPWSSFIPVSIKGGINYRLGDIHKVYFNCGYVTKAPSFENFYNSNRPIAEPKKEKIATFEIGYGLRNSQWDILLSAYYTKWMDKSTTMAFGNWYGAKSSIPNMDALHKGIELEVSYRPIPSLRASGFLSIGDWKWLNDISYSQYDIDGKLVGEYKAYIKDVHVGNAPQTSFAIGVDYNLFKGFNIGVNTNLYARMYAEFQPETRTNEAYKGDSWKTPTFCTVDLNANYNLKIGIINSQLFINVNNVLNNKYISDATDGKDHNRETSYVWYGTGTTWTVGLRLKY